MPQPSARADMPAPETRDEAEVLRAELAALEKQEEVAKLRAELAAKKQTMQARDAARAAVPTEDVDRDSPNTWILLPESPDEVELGKAWVAAHCPIKLEQRMCESELDLRQLRREDVVMCLVRGKGKRAPMSLHSLTTTTHGEKISVPRSHEELFPDISLTTPVRCADYWQMEAGRFNGSLLRAAFLAAIGAVCTPLAPRMLDVASARAGEAASRLVLRAL